MQKLLHEKHLNDSVDVKLATGEPNCNLNADKRTKNIFECYEHYITRNKSLIKQKSFSSKAFLILIQKSEKDIDENDALAVTTR